MFPSFASMDKTRKAFIVIGAVTSKATIVWHYYYFFKKSETLAPTSSHLRFYEPFKASEVKEVTAI